MKYFVLLLILASFTPVGAAPNIVFIFIDDMGYGDIGPFGNTANQTPNLDRMAAEGNVLRHFYVSNTACTPSRSALMTGTYASRIGMDGMVTFPGDRRGLNPGEITIAEMLKAQGYATGCFGKWHLGDQPSFLPTKQGFDEYFGIPYSNDMWPGNQRGNPLTKRGPYTPLPVMRQDKPVAYVSDGADQALLAEVITEEAVTFIKKHKDESFFLYVPHAYVHNPRFARPAILEKAEGNVNRANVEEVDASVGRILDTLCELKLDRKTLVIFTSDNGGASGMSMGPLRGGKGGPKYEGHMRVPTIAWWPGKIAPGTVTDEIATTVDILPSLAKLAGATVPKDRKIDGKDALDVLLGKPGATSPHEILFYEGDGIRRGKWKLVRTGRGRTELYDLDTDPGERRNLARQRPQLAKELGALLTEHAADIRKVIRQPGMVQDPKPIISRPGDLPRLRTLINLADPQVSAPAPAKKSKRRQQAAAPHPNILIIFTDDQGYADLGCFGSKTNKTPRLDQLAKEGTRFTSFYSQTVCGPSRSALLTGRHPIRSKGWGMPASEITFAELMKNAVTVCRVSSAGRERCRPGECPMRSSPRSTSCRHLQISLALLVKDGQVAAEDILVADFELDTWANWTAKREAFGPRPAAATGGTTGRLAA